MNLYKNELIETYIKSLYNEDTKTLNNIISDKYLLKGMNKEQYIKKEIEDFYSWKEFIKLEDIDIFYHDKIDNNYEFCLINNKTNKLLYDDFIKIENDIIIGDDYPAEIITKLCFNVKNNTISESRAFAIKEHNNIIKNVFFKGSKLLNLNITEKYGNKGVSAFSHYHFNLENDNFKKKYIKIYFVSDKKIYKKDVLFRGNNNIFIKKDMQLPSFKENKVYIPENDINYFCLMIQDIDNNKKHFVDPKEKEYIIDKKIKNIVLTDHLDNDWIIHD